MSSFQFDQIKQQQQQIKVVVPVLDFSYLQENNKSKINEVNNNNNNNNNSSEFIKHEDSNRKDKM